MALMTGTMVTMLDMNICYGYLVTNHGSLDLERGPSWSLSTIAFVPSGSAIICQVFFARRVWLGILKYSWLVCIRVGAATAADAILTSVLVYTLHKSRTGMKRTDSIINVLILYSVNTGLIISAANVLCLVCGLVLPQTLTYVVLDSVISSLYLNSVLASLNSRDALNSSTRLGFDDLQVVLPPSSTGTRVQWASASVSRTHRRRRRAR
ncbi:hypothetical protein C8Q76DRAFT_157534 [Earliella scabrosa]|nr:hypothetical protein C8Q76DRAFT_157534 [Earliella scabrosa]